MTRTDLEKETMRLLGVSNETDAMNKLQLETNLISDNAITLADVPDRDLLRVYAELTK